MLSELAELCRCPSCGGTIEARDAGGRCTSCHQDFPEVGGIPCLFADPTSATAEWRRQTRQYQRLVAASIQSMDEQLGQPVLASTRARLERVRAAHQENAERVLELMRSSDLAPDAAEADRTSAGDFELVAYYDHVLRDWAFDDADGDENRRALDMVRDTLGSDANLGRLAVLGAGACRLAYDLQTTARPDRTVVVDHSPLLLLAAKRIVFGSGLRLYEFPGEPAGLESVCVLRELSAKGERPQHFHFLLGDVFGEPLRFGSFDTVLTPWFIDVVPADVRRTLGVIHKLLVPGGRWINYGPLAYPPDHPAVQRYSASELGELARLAGFDLGPIATAWVDLLKSASSARRRSDLVLAFAAKKLEHGPPPSPGDPPGWLLFSHLPIPRFAGLESYRPEHGVLAYVAAQIDGTATLDDIAARLVKDHGARANAAVNGARSLLAIVYQTCKP